MTNYEKAVHAADCAWKEYDRCGAEEKRLFYAIWRAAKARLAVVEAEMEVEMAR